MAGQSPAPAEGPTLRQIGITDAGGPIYTYADRTPVPAPAPAPAARPWVAYVVVGTVAAGALTALAMAAALLAVAVAVGAVAVTACLLVLRSMWAEWSAGQGKPE